MFAGRIAPSSTRPPRRQAGVAAVACLLYVLLPGLFALHAWAAHGPVAHVAEVHHGCSHDEHAAPDGESSEPSHEHGVHCDLCRLIGTASASGLLPTHQPVPSAHDDTPGRAAVSDTATVVAIPAGHLFAPRGPPAA